MSTDTLNETHGEPGVRFDAPPESKIPVHAPSQSKVTVVESHSYPGSGTAEDPFIVDWDEDDPENPKQWSKKRRWILTLQLSIATWNVSFASSVYSGGLKYTVASLHTSSTVAVLGISLFVLGFGLGPLFFAPLSEMYGRRIVFICSVTCFFLLNIGGALAPNIQTLIVCRFLGGTAGSAPLTNAGGQLSDIWLPRDRGFAAALYSLCTFFGPISGPIVGGFISESSSEAWRIDFWIMFAISGVVTLFAFLNLSETYPPVLLRRRAKQLQTKSGDLVYFKSIHERKDSVSKREVILTNLQRPIVLLFKEPIVTCISLYISIVYATLYAMFTAFPIVFEEHRHWTPGETGLAFLGIALGQWIGIASTPIYNRIYWRAMKKGGGKAPPEARLYAAMAGAISLPIGMFWFAWTTFPSIPAVVSIIGTVPFGFAMIAIFTSLNGYIMDAYPLYSASALASTVLLRSTFAAAFPLFSPIMFERLGDQWGCSVFGFLAVACIPIPILFHKYGSWIRSRSRYAIKTVIPQSTQVELRDSDARKHKAMGEGEVGTHTKPDKAQV